MRVPGLRPADAVRVEIGVIRALIAEPDEIVRAVLVRSVSADGVLAHATPGLTSAALVEAATDFQADVVVAGPSCPHQVLLMAVPRLVAVGARTLVVSAAALDDRSSMLLLAGASGFLLIQDASMEDLTNAVHTVASGRTVLHPAVVQAVLDRWRADRNPSDEAVYESVRAEQALTARERDVLAGLRDGLTNRQLAVRLGVAEKTVETHKSRLYAKLGARNQAQAVRIASERYVT